MEGQRQVPPYLWSLVVNGLLIFVSGCRVSARPDRLQVDPRMLGLFGVIVVLLALLAFASSRQRLRRAQALSAWAAQMGLTFQRQARVAPELQGFSVFRQFRRQTKIRNVVGGHRATGDFTIFDYTVSGPSGPPQSPVSVFNYTIAAFRLAGAALPAFAMTPTILHRTPGKLRAVVFKEVGFESSPGFSGRFSLRIKDQRDEQVVRTLFANPVVSFFETFDPGHKWSVEGEGEWLIAYWWREGVSAEEFGDFFDNATSIAELFVSTTNGRRLT